MSKLSAYERFAQGSRGLWHQIGKRQKVLLVSKELRTQLLDELSEGGISESRLSAKALLWDLQYNTFRSSEVDDWWEMTLSAETIELLILDTTQGADAKRIKLLKVDGPARRKGYRTGQIHTVLYADHTANPERGLLYWVQKRGARPEGFYRDQFRPKPKHAKTEKTQ